MFAYKDLDVIRSKWNATGENITWTNVFHYERLEFWKHQLNFWMRRTAWHDEGAFTESKVAHLVCLALHVIVVVHLVIVKWHKSVRESRRRNMLLRFECGGLKRTSNRTKFTKWYLRMQNIFEFHIQRRLSEYTWSAGAAFDSVCFTPYNQ